MKRVYLLPALVALLAAFSSPTFAQDSASEPQSASALASSSETLTTKLHSVLLPEPATEEGFATVRIADASGEAVYRGMIPLVAGARSLDLSKVSVPAAGSYTLRVVYPGGTMMEELKTPYNQSPTVAMDMEVAADR